MTFANGPPPASTVPQRHGIAEEDGDHAVEAYEAAKIGMAMVVGVLLDAHSHIVDHIDCPAVVGVDVGVVLARASWTIANCSTSLQRAIPDRDNASTSRARFHFWPGHEGYPE